jgi:LPS sulfotransferase NodH
VLEFVGIDVPADFHVEPRTERQSDAVNEDWIRRYREQSSAQ